MTLILLGAPGAGKGTRAEYIMEALSIPSISTGNLLREAVKNQTFLGLRAKDLMDAGKLVSDEVVVSMVKDRLMEPDCANGCIFDGFPRTLHQAEELDKITNVDMVISIEVPDEVIEERMTGRRVCQSCGATYHISSAPPKIADVCDKCGDALIVREDDSPEVVRQRLHTYHEQSEPLKGYYEAQGKLRMIVGTGTVEEGQKLIAKVLGIE
ncbi:MAG: adenylate kinase [Bacillota bacterium]|nr:adenylate kinase [Bacillota bacterium]